MNNSQNIDQCIRQSLNRYFEELGDEKPENVWNMVFVSVERALLETIMTKAGGNQTQAAAMLGITRTTLRKKLSNHNLLD